AEESLRWILIIPDREHVGIIRALQFRFDVFDFVLLYKEKVAIEICRHISSLIVADSIEIAQHPWKRIYAGANEMSGEVIVGRVAFCDREKRLRQSKYVVVRLDVRVRLVRRRAPEIVKPDA